MGIFEDLKNNRDARAQTPEFIAAMEQEKRELSNILDGLGKATLNAGYGLILKVPAAAFSASLKKIYDTKSNHSTALKELGKITFGKNGVAHNIVKIVASVMHLCGKVPKVGIRKLLAI